jgi:hypothetical protein
MSMSASAWVLSTVLTGLLGVSGNGNLKEEVRPVKEFTSVSFNGGIKASITVGDKTEVKVKTDENILPLVETVVEGSTLIVRPKRGSTVSTTQGIQVTLVTPKLLGITANGGVRVDAQVGAMPRFQVEANGGAHVEVKGLRTDDLDVDASGGVRLVLAGEAKKVSLDMSGGVKADLDGLVAQQVHVDGSGGVSANVHATAQVDVDLSGGATVHVKGNPKERNVDTSGGARVKFD